MVSDFLNQIKAKSIQLEAEYYRLNDTRNIEQRNDVLAQLNENEKLYESELTKEQGIITPPSEKVIPNNEIIGPDLVPAQTINPGQVNKIPLLPIAAGVGIIILAVALTKRRKR